MAAAGDLAAVDKPGRAGIPRKLAERGVIFFCFELRAEHGVFRHRLCFALVALEPCCFCHRTGNSMVRPGSGKLFLKEIAGPGNPA